MFSLVTYIINAYHSGQIRIKTCYLWRTSLAQKATCCHVLDTSALDRQLHDVVVLKILNFSLVDSLKSARVD